MTTNALIINLINENVACCEHVNKKILLFFGQQHFYYRISIILLALSRYNNKTKVRY